MSSDHFVMSAVLVKDEDLPKADALLATIRTALLRAPGQTLHWRNLKQHSSRLYRPANRVIPLFVALLSRGVQKAPP
jgi:hypothetical protein